MAGNAYLQHGMTGSLDRYFLAAGRGNPLPGLIAWCFRARWDEPPTLLHFRRYGDRKIGQAILDGQYASGGHTTRIDSDLWTGKIGNPDHVRQLHSFIWLEDLLSLQTPSAAGMACMLLEGWLDACGNGKGGGWKPEIIARRLLWWIRNYPLIRVAATGDLNSSLLAAINRQTALLRAWRHLVNSAGIRLEIETAIMVASVFKGSIDGRETGSQDNLVSLAMDWFDHYRRQPVRNPQNLLRMAFLLSMAIASFRQTGVEVTAGLQGIASNMAEFLSSMRLSDMELCRMHGGGMTPAGLLVGTLADLGSSGSRTSIKPAAEHVALETAGMRAVMLASANRGNDQRFSHPLSIEVSSGVLPIFANGGSGKKFGGDILEWAASSAAYSTVSISRKPLLDEVVVSGGLAIPGGRQAVNMNTVQGDYRLGTYASAEHHGYRHICNATAMREIWLTADGLTIQGIDTVTIDDTSPVDGIWFRQQFNLHPSVEVLDGSSTSYTLLGLPNGERWQFELASNQMIRIVESYFLDDLQHEIWETSRIVIDSLLNEGETSFNWQLGCVGT